MIYIENVAKKYHHQWVLENISMEIPTGSCIGLMGKSGSGKSTLGRLVAGIETPDRGEIRVVNQKQGDCCQSSSLVTQMVFQDALGAVNPRFTVEDVLQEAFRFAKRWAEKGRASAMVTCRTVAERQAYFVQQLETVGLNASMLTQKAHSLSGGQLQRLCLARALLMEPDILILDEALSGLDPLVQQEMLRLLGRIRKEQGMTMLFIAHDLGASYYLCDILYVMHQGRLVWKSEPLETYTYEEVVEKMEYFEKTWGL